MKKTVRMILVGLVVILVAVVAEAGDQYYSPTLDAWRLAGQRNGYDHGYRDGYYGYPLAHLGGYAPEYRDGYSLGYRDGAYHRGRGECGGCGGGYGYGQGSYPAPQPVPQIYWGISIRGKHGGIRIGGQN